MASVLGTERGLHASFSVWLRPIGNGCKVRVEGRDNADRVRSQLPPTVTATEPQPVAGSPCCVFRVTYGPGMSHAAFEQLVTAIPGASLMVDPA